MSCFYNILYNVKNVMTQNNNAIQQVHMYMYQKLLSTCTSLIFPHKQQIITNSNINGLRLPTIYLNHACQMTLMTSNVLTFWKDNKEKYSVLAGFHHSSHFSIVSTSRKDFQPFRRNI